jgi:3-hydroxyacyl-CoA dehydrogenase
VCRIPFQATSHFFLTGQRIYGLDRSPVVPPTFDSVVSQKTNIPPDPVIRRAAVLGAGVMGGQIAAHLANAGVPTLLLDVSAAAARDGLERAARLQPDPFFTRATRDLIAVGGFDDGLAGLAEVGWVVESIVEDVEAKRDLLARVAGVRGPGTIVSSNTSGIPLALLAEGLDDGCRRHLLGTHFFNPPRYLTLLEVIPGPDTDPAVVARIARFADFRLGKGVVLAHDRPGFIANRIAIYGLALTLKLVAAGRIGIADVDALTGPLIGRPRTATFRTLDLAGIDVLARVAGDLSRRLDGPGEAEAFQLPALVDALVARGWTGSKAGQGFYRKTATGAIQVLDPVSMDYATPAAQIAGLDGVERIDDPGARLRALFLRQDAAGAFLRDTLGALLIYAARVLPEVADSIDAVDRAMRWGFGWELGPFETWDAIGVETVIAGCGLADLPEAAAEARARGAFRPVPAAASGTSSPARVPPASEAAGLLPRARSFGVIRSNAGASLLDLGDGALMVELHSKMNLLGGDAMQMLSAALTEADASARPLVIGTGGANFSAGANLTLILLEAQQRNWDEIDLMVRAFQRITAAIRHAGVPVVVAPLGLTLGGGCEICLHAAHVDAAAETYMGLVETGVGLIPAGGGTKEMLGRALDIGSAAGDVQAVSQQVFETIAFARTSTSASHARELGYLRPSDGIRMNRERLLAAARAAARLLADDYVPRLPRPAIRVGGAGTLAALQLGIHLARRAGRISDHDVTVGRALARVIAGGDLAHEGTISEQGLLDLEREAFLSLCGELRTQERIAHTLRTGKPLRN